MINTLLINLIAVFFINSDTTIFKDKGRIEKDSLLKVYEQIQNKPNETKLVDWGKDGDRYIMFLVEKGESFIQIADTVSDL